MTELRLHLWINEDILNGVRMLRTSEHLWRCYWCNSVVTMTGTTDTPNSKGCGQFVDTSGDKE